MTVRPKLQIESVSHHRDPAFLAALRLFERTFPAKEKIDRRYFAEMLQEKRLGLLFPFNIHFLVARAGGRVVGLVTGSYLAVVNAGFVGYLAVAPGTKGSRLGTLLRNRLLQELRRDARASGREDVAALVGEVEAGNRWLRHLVRTRGVLALDFDYRQPPLGEDTGEVPLVLYVEPVARPLRRMSTRNLRALVYAIYRRIYRIRFPLREPAFRRMLRELEGRRWVGVRRLGAPARSSPASGDGVGGPRRRRPASRPRRRPTARG